MNAGAAAVPAFSTAARFIAVLLVTALKGSLVFAAVYGASRLMRKGDPGLRHLLWLAAVVSYPLILALSLVDLPLLPSAGRPPLSGEGLYGSLSSVLLPKPDGSSVAGSSAVPAASVRGFPWSILALPVWAVGALLSLSRIAVGILWVHRLRAEATGARQAAQPHRLERAARCAGRWGAIVGELAGAAGVARPVRVLESRCCQVPFAAGALRPLIVLPRAARRWPAERLRAVLLHELKHIQRWDPLTQMAAFAACSLFWFVPLIWVAYSLLYTEQEKACDSGVVRSGVALRRYAVCLLDVARLCREPAAFSSLYSPKGRHRILTERIRHIVNGVLSPGKGRRVFAVAAALVCLLILAGAVGFRPPPWDEALFQSSPNDRSFRRFVGQWVNTQRIQTWSKLVIKRDHVMELFVRTDAPTREGTLEIRKIWVNAEGGTCCQFQAVVNCDGHLIGLMRLAPAGKVLEYNIKSAWGDGSPWPEKIDPRAPMGDWVQYMVFDSR